MQLGAGFRYFNIKTISHMMIAHGCLVIALFSTLIKHMRLSNCLLIQKPYLCIDAYNLLLQNKKKQYKLVPAIFKNVIYLISSSPSTPRSCFLPVIAPTPILINVVKFPFLVSQ